MPQLIECPSCKRRLTAPEGTWDRQMRCPSCGSTFSVDASGNAIAPVNTAILGEQSLTHPIAIAQRQTIDIPEDDPYEIFANKDLDPGLLNKIVDPSGKRRWSSQARRPFLLGVFLSLTVGVGRFFAYAHNPDYSRRNPLTDVVPLTFLCSLMTGFFLYLSVHYFPRKRESGRFPLLPYVTFAVVWPVCWAIIQFLNSSFRSDVQTMDEWLLRGTVALVVAAFANGFLAPAAGAVIRRIAKPGTPETEGEQ